MRRMKVKSGKWRREGVAHDNVGEHGQARDRTSRARPVLGEADGSNVGSQRERPLSLLELIDDAIDALLEAKASLLASEEEPWPDADV